MSDRTELFLDKYKYLEAAAAQEYDLPSDGKIIARLEDMPAFKDIKSELAYCREVRNLLQHKPKIQGTYAVEPSDKMIELLDRTIQKVTNPPRARDVAIPKAKILYKTMDDFVRPAMEEMLKRSFTHIPILDDGVVAGVFSENTILTYLVEEQIIGIEDTTRFSDFADYLPIGKHRAETFKFIPQNLPLAQVADIFERASDRQERIGLIFTTHSGKATEKILGIITASDVAGTK